MRYCSGRSRASAVRHPKNVLQKPVPASGNEFTGGIFMNAVIMWIMAAGAVIGGIDRIMGNRLGLGRRFEEGFELLGATALSMAGIICLVPLLSKALRLAVVPVWTALGLDPAMLGGIIAIDMGGFQLSRELAQSSSVASYSGIIVAATFGCTVSFTIPVGMGRMDKEARSSGSSRKAAPAPSSDRSAFARECRAVRGRRRRSFPAAAGTSRLLIHPSHSHRNREGYRASERRGDDDAGIAGNAAALRELP